MSPSVTVCHSESLGAQNEGMWEVPARKCFNSGVSAEKQKLVLQNRGGLKEERRIV